MMDENQIPSEKRKHQNHHHEVTENQTVVDLGSGEFVADNERLALLKALNDCGLITRTHCYGPEVPEDAYSFISILFKNDLSAEIRDVPVEISGRKFDAATELLLVWKRTD